MALASATAAIAAAAAAAAVVAVRPDEADAFAESSTRSVIDADAHGEDGLLGSGDDVEGDGAALGLASRTTALANLPTNEATQHEELRSVDGTINHQDAQPTMLLPSNPTDKLAPERRRSPLNRTSTTPEFIIAPTPGATATSEGDRPSTAHALSAASLPGLINTTPAISAIHPNVSRHNSSTSTASRLRSGSPFRRDTTTATTVATERKSRPLSMVWGDWLRDKTRSKSRSSRNEKGERSGSRPASMMVLPTSSTNTTTPAFSLGDLSDVAVYSSSPTAPIVIPQRSETWNDPDAVLPPPRTPETREAFVAERLGVLPSPAPTALTFNESGSPDGMRRRRGSSAAGGKVGSIGGGELETVPSEESVAEGSPVRDKTTSAAAGRASPVRLPPTMMPLRKVSEVEESAASAAAVVKRPEMQKRRISDLEMLPSEQKRRSLVGSPPQQQQQLGMPRPDSLILLQSQVDLLAGAGRGAENDEGVQHAGVVLGADDANASQLMEDDHRPATGYSSGKGTTADAWDDARSEVSAEEGAVEEVPGVSTNPGTSRHSSVSSLGAPDSFSASQGALNESTQAETTPLVALLPTAGGLDIPSAPQQKLQRPFMTERALSYQPLPRDEDGLPVPETITTGSSQQAIAAPSTQQVVTAAPLQPMTTTASLQQTETLNSNDLSPVPVDIGAMSGPPPGTPPFQQHPVFRNSLVQSGQSNVVQAPVPVRSAITQDTTTTPDAVKTKRRSGFFRTKTGEASTVAVAPPPNRITDNHGLEDLQASDDESVRFARPGPGNRQTGDKQNRRRSGIWDVLTTKRASSGGKLDMGGESPAVVAPLPPPAQPSAKEREETANRKLKKPQRASSSAVELQPKKKRFSALGSIFGRSDTARQAPQPKFNKLTKMAPSSSENVRRTESPRQDRPIGGGSTVSGNVGSYEEYEARRKREAAAFQGTAARVRSPVAGGVQERPAPAFNAAPVQPLEGWYGRNEAQAPPLQQPSLPAVDVQPEYRRLHSQGRTSARPTSQVPQAFRPVEASFNAPVAPVGPPPDPRIVQSRGADPVQSPQHSRRFSFDRQNSYGSAYASEFSGFSGQQVAGQMQQQQQSPPSQSSFGPDVSPIMTRTRPPPTQAQRVVSRGTETARSPAHDYADQQTPWAITIPPGGQGSTRTSRASSWDTPPENGAQYPGPPPGAPYHQQYPSRSEYTGPYFPPPAHEREYPQPAYPYEGGAHMSQYSEQEQWQQQYSHAPPRTQQQQQQHFSYPSQQAQNQNYAPQQPRAPPQQQQRYYSQQSQQQQQPQQHIAAQQQQHAYYQQQQQQQFHDPRFAPRNHHRRRSSGYSGRRDDMTAGEEELLVMRGASYPGQEWQPPGLGRSGWD